MFWRADVRVDYWDDEIAAIARGNDVLASGENNIGETGVTFIWETGDNEAIGSAMMELMGRLEPLPVHLTDFGSVHELPD